MGWGRYLLLGDLGQQLDLSDQKEELARLRTEIQRRGPPSADATPAIQQLQQENDELRLYLAAVIRCLVSKQVISGDELKQIVELVDAEDGAQNGRFSGSVV
jgi:hypothetical protein